MVQPIKPSEVILKKALFIPDEVIEAFNELIAKKWNGTLAIIKQNEIVELVGAKLSLDSVRPFDRNWLNVEDIFRDVGWMVVYDKPGFNEQYGATYTFTKKD